MTFAAAPKLFNRPPRITADVVISMEGAEGILITQGCRYAGYAPFLKDGCFHYLHNYVAIF